MPCPICNSLEFIEFRKYPAYKVCQGCGLHMQDPLPAKTYEGPQENFGQGPGTGHLMSDHDKEANRGLAEALWTMFRPETVLDIGSKYPYLLSCLKGRSEVLGIDGIDEVVRYGQELGVPTLKADIEALDAADFAGKYDLVTMVHIMEHLYNPVETLEKVLRFLSGRGNLFIRMPDPEVPGIERDLTGHHLTIHPFLHTRRSLDTLLLKFGYEVFRQDRIEGFGQSDYYIRRICKDNAISLCMIVKNEEKNISDCLESIRRYVDEIIIVDTGSEDKTKEVVSKYTDKIYDFKWVDNFSAARNFALSKCTKNWILWADADDVFQNPGRIKSEQVEGYDVYNFNVLYGNDTFCHARLFRNSSGAHFKGRVHEYPVVHWLKFKKLTDLNVIHKTVKHVTEDRARRNLRILTQEVEDDPRNSRPLFYLANCFRELGRYDSAIETYRRYLILSTWKEERFLAQKYIGQIYQWQKQYTQSTEEFLKAVVIDERWAEAYYYIGENYYFQGKYEICIRWMTFAASLQMPDSPLFKEVNIYKDLPYRYIFACYDSLGKYQEAYEYCLLALDRNPGDEWLKQRLEYFRARVHKATPGDIIECYRQGAMGDIIMTTAALRGLKERDPECFIRYITHKSNVEVIQGNKYVDEVATEGKPDATQKVFFAYPENEGYPHTPLNRHLIRIFNECAGVPDNSLDTEVTLTEEEDDFGQRFIEENGLIKYGRYATLQMQAGWSPYKEWFDDRWHEVVEYMFRQRGIPVVQVGGEKDRLLDNTINMLGLSLKRSFALIKHSAIHLGVDSMLSHVAAAFKKPLVELFGSTSPLGSGYENAIWKEPSCGPCYREYEWAKDPIGPCPYGKMCMERIVVDEVIEKIKGLL